MSSTIIRERLNSVADALAAGRLRRSELESAMGTIGDSAGIIERASAKAAQLIANFKQLATAQSDEQSTRIDVASELQLVAASLQSALREANVEVQIEADDGVTLTGNRGHFEQILLQLFNNAMIHGFNGRPRGQIRVTAKQQDGDLELAFSDDGAGMPAEVKGKIFEPFFTTHFGQGGSGLGLYLVYNMVTASLRGRISVESEPGRGTTFLLQLPQKGGNARQVPSARTSTRTS